MTTRGIMIARIGSELRRGTSINAQILDAINTAIEHYQSVRLFQKDETNTLTTVNAQEFYTSVDAEWLGRVSRLDFVHLIINGVSFPLTFKPNDWLDVASTGQNNGQPYHWGFFGERLRLYPIPSQAFTVRVAGNFEENAPALDGDVGNTWMTTGGTLIRCHAKYELYANVLNNPAKAQEFNPDNMTSPTYRALAALRRRTNAKMSTGYVAPWQV